MSLNFFPLTIYSPKADSEICFTGKCLGKVEEIRKRQLERADTSTSRESECLIESVYLFCIIESFNLC